MKKLLILSLIVAATNLYANEFEVDKAVEGENKKVYENSKRLKDKLEKGDSEDIEIIDLELEKEGKSQEKLSLTPIEDEVNIEEEKMPSFRGEELVISEKNEIFIGAGGFRDLDSIEYGVTHNGKIQKYDLNYKFRLDRLKRGEDRKNSDQSIDRFAVEVNRDALDVRFSHQLKDLEYPGIKGTSNYGARKYREFNVGTGYEIINNGDQKASIELDFYKGESSSVSEFRDYDFTEFDLKAKYEDLAQLSSSTHAYRAEFGYKLDDISTGETDLFYFDFNNKMKFNGIKSYSFDLDLGAEVVNNEYIDDENNFTAGLSVEKPLSKSLSVKTYIAMENRKKLSREIYRGFNYVDDIFNFSNLKTEEFLKAGVKFSYAMDRSFLSLDIRHINGDNVLEYSALNIGNEIGINVANRPQDESWQELDLRYTYKFDNKYRATSLISLNSADDKFTYTPAVTANVKAIFESGKYYGDLTVNYFGDMYASRDINDNLYQKLDGRATIDLGVSYKLLNNVKLGFAVTNLLDSDEDKMPGYPVDERKYKLTFNMNY